MRWSDPNSDPLGDIRRLADKIKADYGLREPCQRWAVENNMKVRKVVEGEEFGP